VIAFDEARTRAAACGFPLRGDEAIETDRWWFFPVRQIGSFGVVVDKTDGRCTCLGSAGRLEDWLWAYDAGLLDPGDLVVTHVSDPARTRELLRAASFSVSADDLQALPLRRSAETSWMRLAELRTLAPAIARWHVEGPRGVRAPFAHSQPVLPVEPTWSEPLQASALAAYVRWWAAPEGLPPLSPPPDEQPTEATDVLLHELQIRGPKALVVFDATDPVTELRHRHHWIVAFATPAALAHIARFSRPA